MRRERVPLTDEQRRIRRLVWGVIAGIIVIASIGGLISGLIGSKMPRPLGTSPAGRGSAAPQPSTPKPAPAGAVVDESVTRTGWVPEPITTIVAQYAVSAARAGTSYDTTLATREEFVNYLTTWHTEDPRFTTPADREKSFKDKIQALRNYVVIPQATWDELSLAKAILTAKPEGAVKTDYDHISAPPGSLDKLIAGGFHDATVDLVVTYSKIDSSSGERIKYDERITVSMQLQCGHSAPVARNGQDPADCKLIRFYDKPMV